MKRRRPPNAFEQEVLDVMLVELRRAMRLRVQLEVLVDPWALGDGTFIYAAPSVAGRSYTIDHTATSKKRGGR